MRKVTALFAAAVAPLALACGADPPVVCGDAIPQQQVFVNEQKTVDVCFEDPGDLELTVAAASSNTDIVGTLLRGNSVGIAGVAPGEATVTATATNTENLTAETSFSVLVPNRAPNFVSTLNEANVLINRSLTWNLMEFFEEPDGQEMTFSAASSNNSAVVVTVDGSSAQVTGLSEGTSQVTLTATDPEGLEGDGTIEVTVKVPVTVWEYEFETDDDLDDWEWVDTTAKVWVENGALNIQSLREGFFAIAERSNRPAEDFTLEFTVSNPGGQAQAGIIWITGDTVGDQAYRLIVSAAFGNDNWLFHKWDGQWTEVETGYSDAIDFDVFQDWSVAFSDVGELLINVDGEEAVDLSIGGSTGTIELIWLLGPEEISEYEYARLSGVFVQGDAAHHPRIALSAKQRKLMLPMLDEEIKR